jgi:hypothetical protein
MHLGDGFSVAVLLIPFSMACGSSGDGTTPVAAPVGSHEGAGGAEMGDGHSGAGAAPQMGEGGTVGAGGQGGASAVDAGQGGAPNGGAGGTALADAAVAADSGSTGREAEDPGKGTIC